MNKIYFTIAVALLTVSCNNEVKQSDYDKLKAELTECKKTVEDLQNTPQVRLSNGQQFLSKNDIVNAKKEFNALIEKFTETEEAQKAKTLIANIEKEEKEKKEAEERKRTLGFKILKENSSVTVGDITVKFTSVSTGQRFNFDHYSDESWGRNAERGEIYILSKISISSEIKDPELPPVAIYKVSNGNLTLEGTMDYRFQRWRDYGAYLGNYADYGNDFSHTKTIPFSLGETVSKEDFDNNAFFVVVKKQNCFYRKSERFNNPPVSYTSSGCNLKSTLTVDDFDKDYALVKIFNKNKL
ncbi:hypothetical protein HX088_06295 [Empedobacter sp. 225-1]|uniref:hypothetical protein n=1 Tax=unclassified Empedobacter TaxID=2643773 RepID=UPI002576C0B8|nr:MULTISPECIES: hypothetical protein [unclassified Empedobacter]MDM1522890.1 hypothetical protein [Empedobacter sp. 225-1]MDM1542942.1 hypothetical protein [Empedobacter sp. 189-2]